MFYQLEPDIYAVSGITKEPQLPGFGTSFLLGARITAKIPTPMIFKSNFTRDDPPKSFVGLSIPIWSRELVDFFRRIGVDNFECFEATITAKKPELEWSNYFAVNILGLVAAADMKKSKYIEITSSPSGVPFAGFHDLVVDGKKARPFDLFRLAENAATLLASERVIQAFRNNPRVGGWGISAIKVAEV